MLKKKRILISQPRPDTTHSPYFDIEKNRGVEIIFRPMIKVEPISEKDYRYGNGPTIKGYTAVIFTSKHGVVNFFRLIKELRAEIPDDMKYFCFANFFNQHNHRDSLKQQVKRECPLLTLLLPHGPCLLSPFCCFFHLLSRPQHSQASVYGPLLCL